MTDPMAIGDRLKRLFGRGGKSILAPQPELSRSVLRDTKVDDYIFDSYAEDSEKFKRICVEEAPVVLTPANDNLPRPYDAWEDLTRDVFASYHGDRAPELDGCEIDPAVELHKRILPKLYSQEEHAEARSHTRNDPMMSALATMAAVGSLRETLQEELEEQAQQAQEFQERRREAHDAQKALEGRREKARQEKAEGAVSDQTQQEIRAAVQARQEAVQAAEGAVPPPMSSEAAQAIAAAAEKAGEVTQQASEMPAFGYGVGGDGFTYESPEQALEIAEKWATNPDLKRMAELFGRLDKDMRFQRSRRIVRGQDELVDIEFGDNLRRVVPAELALFADPDFEDDFLARYLAGELLQFSTIGEEHAGRGPVVLCVDGSGSMSGTNNCWARAVAMSLLHICRAEKRDFAMVEFSGTGQQEWWMFKARDAVAAEHLLEMCSHFFGGGTYPYAGISTGAQIMDNAPEFSKADICLIGDGIAPFKNEDRELRDRLKNNGINIYAVGIGCMGGYLEEYADHAVEIHEFELDGPNDASRMLATHLG